MLSINKISGIENNYNNKRNKISFQSRFFPNDALKDAFFIAKHNMEFTNHSNVENGRDFARIIEHLLNDGKNDLIKVTRSKKGSTITINGKRVNFYREQHEHSGFIDGERVIKNIIEYFSWKNNTVDTTKLTSGEFKAIKPAIDTLNSDLNADDAKKNARILYNLNANMYNINKALHNYSVDLLKKLEAKIFNK